MNDCKLDELSAYRPSSPYSASKAAADHLVNAWHRTYGMPTLISTASNNYGPWQHREKLIPAVIKRALANLPVRIYGSGKQQRDWLHVDDHVRAIEAVALHGQPGETYNVCTEILTENIQLIKRIVQLVEKQTGLHPVLEFVADRPGHDFCYRVSSKKIRDALGGSLKLLSIPGWNRR